VDNVYHASPPQPYDFAVSQTDTQQVPVTTDDHGYLTVVDEPHHYEPMRDVRPVSMNHYEEVRPQ